MDRVGHPIAQGKQLSDIEVSVEQLDETQQATSSKQAALSQQQQQLNDETATLDFQRTKRISKVQQKQKLELARLKHEHSKQALMLDRRITQLKSELGKARDHIQGEPQRLSRRLARRFKASSNRHRNVDRRPVCRCRPTTTGT